MHRHQNKHKKEVNVFLVTLKMSGHFLKKLSIHQKVVDMNGFSTDECQV